MGAEVLLGAALFAVGVVTDWFWTRWAQAVQAKRRVVASGWAVAICLPAGLWVPAYSKSRWFVVPFALGCGLGTYWSVKR